MDGEIEETPAAPTGYVAELLQQWRPLAATTLALAAGFPFSPYIAAIMGPHLIKDLGWSRAEFASLGGLLMVGLICYPLAGRVSDFLGVKRTALIGTIALPATYVALSFFNGDINQYALIWVVQICAGTAVGAMVYTRGIVHFVKRARGLAFAIAGSGPALAGAIAAPLLNNYVEIHGWRSGYLLSAAFMFIASMAAILLLPPISKEQMALDSETPGGRSPISYRAILSLKAFWFLAGGIFLCNFPLSLSTTQLNVLLLEHGVSTANASGLIAALASGTLVGRFACGFALDRFAPNLISALGMGLPVIGYALLALHLDTTAILTLALFVIGFAYGAENDVLAFLIARHFDARTYGRVFGMMMAVLTTTSSLGALLLGATIRITNSFTLFLWISAVLVCGGAALLFLLAPQRSHRLAPE